MRFWTRRKTLVAGVALIVLSNAVVLSGVVINRSGEPESRVTLSERELGLPGFRSYRQVENSGLALTLNWRVLEDEESPAFNYSIHNGRPAWLDATLLSALGFDTAAGAASQEAREHFLRQLPRQVLLVLENEGPAWQQSVARARADLALRTAVAEANPGNRELASQAKSSRDNLAVEEKYGSRLFAIDAGLDAAALRSRHPDRGRTLIVRATIRPAVAEHDRQWRLTGYVSQVLDAEINVPFAFRPFFEALPESLPRPEQAPRYQIRLSIGQRLEAWIEAVSPQPTGGASAP